MSKRETVFVNINVTYLFDEDNVDDNVGDSDDDMDKKQR